jgi:hypothetical protein
VGTGPRGEAWGDEDTVYTGPRDEAGPRDDVAGLAKALANDAFFDVRQPLAAEAELVNQKWSPRKSVT